MLVYVALGVAVLALLVAVAAFIRATAVLEHANQRFQRAQELFNKQGGELTRLNSKIDKGQTSLRKSLSDFRGEIRRALTEPEPQEETPTDVAPVEEEPKPKRRKRRARLNLFERIAADETTVPDDEDEDKK